MTNNVYAVHDCNASFLEIVGCWPEDAVALRVFAGTLMQGGSNYSRFPDDYMLICLGQCDLAVETDERWTETFDRPICSLGDIATQFGVKLDDPNGGRTPA